MSDTAPRWAAGPLTRAAFAIAVGLFADKARKVGDTPYLPHLLAVSALVMEHGGSEVQAAPGRLHDVIEDIKIRAPTCSECSSPTARSRLMPERWW